MAPPERNLLSHVGLSNGLAIAKAGALDERADAFGDPDALESQEGPGGRSADLQGRRGPWATAGQQPLDVPGPPQKRRHHLRGETRARTVRAVTEGTPPRRAFSRFDHGPAHARPATNRPPQRLPPHPTNAAKVPRSHANGSARSMTDVRYTAVQLIALQQCSGLLCLSCRA